MSWKLLRLSFLVTMSTSTPLLDNTQILSPLAGSIIRAQLLSQHTAVPSAAIMANHRRHACKHYSPGLSISRAANRKGIQNGLWETIDSQDTFPTEENVITSSSFEPTFLKPTNGDSGMRPGPTVLAATGETVLDPSDASNSWPSLFPNLDKSQQSPESHSSLHGVIISALVGGAMGAVLLAGLTLLVVCRRRIRSHRSRRDIRGLHGWFSSDKTDDVIFIRVPPPTMRLKSILIRNTSLSSTSDDVYSDRISLTSTQMSVIINKLPKSYDSGLEDGVLDEAKENSLIKAATRIGPSQSDFLTSLFGLNNADSFGSSISSTSGVSTLPSNFSSDFISQSLPRPQPLTPPYSTYELPSLTLVNSPKPTFPPAVAFPTSSHTGGPRGHALLLTGGSTIIQTFAQWHHQRSMARGKDGNSRYGPRF